MTVVEQALTVLIRAEQAKRSDEVMQDAYNRFEILSHYEKLGYYLMGIGA